MFSIMAISFMCMLVYFGSIFINIGLLDFKFNGNVLRCFDFCFRLTFFVFHFCDLRDVSFTDLLIF